MSKNVLTQCSASAQPCRQRWHPVARHSQALYFSADNPFKLSATHISNPVAWMPASIGEICLFTSGKEPLRRSLREVLSTPAVFDRTCRRAYMATLQGTVKAFQFDEISRSLKDSWTGLAGGPILATPAVLSSTGALVVANVHGYVRCFSREGIGMHSS